MNIIATPLCCLRSWQCITCISLPATTKYSASNRRGECVKDGYVPVGVLLRKEEEGVMGGVTGGVRFPLVWRGWVETLLRDRLPVRDNLGCTFFFTASCSLRAASVMNLAWWDIRLVMKRGSSNSMCHERLLTVGQPWGLQFKGLLWKVCYCRTRVWKKKNITGSVPIKKHQVLWWIVKSLVNVFHKNEMLT